MNRYHLLARYPIAIGALVWAWSAGPPAFHHDDLLAKANSAFAQGNDSGDAVTQPQKRAQTTSNPSIDHLISNIIGGKAAPNEAGNQDRNVDGIISGLLGGKAMSQEEEQEEEKVTDEKAAAPEKPIGRDDIVDRVISSATERQKAFKEPKKTAHHAPAGKKSRTLAATPKAATLHAPHSGPEGSNQPPRAKPAPPKPTQPELAQAKPAQTETTQAQSAQMEARDRASESDNAFEPENGRDQGQSSGPRSAGFDVASGADSGKAMNAFGEPAKMGMNASGQPPDHSPGVGEARATGDGGQGRLASMISPYVPEWLRQMSASYAFVSLFAIGVIIALLAGAIHSRREEFD